ncbi:MAG: SDR family NAD(P)-dependent oxidoreductase [Acidimicrobiia bacterium]
MRLRERIALVTGAGSGIGASTAALFAAEGATVVVNDVARTAAEQTAAALPRREGGHWAFAADVASSAAVGAMFDDVRDRHGRLDVLVNNAGISEGAPGETARVNTNAAAVLADVMGGAPRAVHWDITPHITDESWSRMLAVHLSGTFFCCRAAIPLMEAAGGGSIVNLSSAGALLGQPGVPHYAAAKAGILGLTRSLAGELGSRGVRVNALCPGTIDTPMTKDIDEAFRIMVAATAPLPRLADPGEVATAALFLASDESSFFTGQTLEPNGGIHM